MDNNVHEISGITVVVNGGNPLEGCPKDLDEARLIERKLNEGKAEDKSEPLYSFDCGFKLDYDGPLLRISSRFYPPKTHYGHTWDGRVMVKFMDKILAERLFDCATLEELQKQVEEYVGAINEKIKDLFKTLS